MQMFAHRKHRCNRKVCSQQLAFVGSVWQKMAMKLRVKQLRRAHGWTIDQLAEVTGLSRGFISQIENEKREPGPSTLETLADAFKVQIVDLYDAGDAQQDLAAIAQAMKGMTPEQRATAVRLVESLRSPQQAD